MSNKSKKNQEESSQAASTETPKPKRVISPEHRAKLVANAKKAGEARAQKIAARKAAEPAPVVGATAQA